MPSKIDQYTICDCDIAVLKRKKRNRKKPAIGCSYLLIIGSVTTVLLVVNIFLVGIFITVNRGWLLGFYPDEKVQFRIAQALQIFIPVILTFFQFWIFDRLVDKAFGYGQKLETDK